MNKALFKENGEQGFPYILPVLRSYKQSIMFVSKEESISELELPEINKRYLDQYSGSPSKKHKKKYQKKKLNKPQRKNTVNIQYSPHFNIPTGRNSTLLA